MGSTRFLIVQAIAVAIGIGIYFVLTLLDLEALAEHRLFLIIFNALFIGMLLIWGVSGTTGSRSWLDFPFLPINIQPAEICKITFILILAKTMSVHRNRISSLRAVSSAAFQLLFIFSLVIVIAEDAGVASIFLFIFLIMAFVGGMSGWWFLGGFAAVGVAAPLVWRYFLQDYQKNRIMMFWDPTIDPSGIGVRWDTNLSLSMLSGGGLIGEGLYHGTMTQAGSIAAQHTDFIFSTIGEELGIVGCIVTVLLLVLIIVRCVYVGMKTPNYMNRLICIGVAGMMAYQVLVNVGMCIGVFPVVGLTLPFISYGGSSTITMFLGMGLVSSVHMRPNTDAASHYIHYPY